MGGRARTRGMRGARGGARGAMGRVAEGVQKQVKRRGIRSTAGPAGKQAGRGLGARRVASEASLASGGYGKRALMEEGSVTLFNDKDTIVAGTNLDGRRANDATFTPEGTNTNISDGNTGGGVEPQPLQVNVEATQQNDVFARTDKNAETFHMVQTKSDGLFA